MLRNNRPTARRSSVTLSHQGELDRRRKSGMSVPSSEPDGAPPSLPGSPTASLMGDDWHMAEAVNCDMPSDAAPVSTSKDPATASLGDGGGESLPLTPRQAAPGGEFEEEASAQWSPIETANAFRLPSSNFLRDTYPVFDSVEGVLAFDAVEVYPDPPVSYLTVTYISHCIKNKDTIFA